MHLLPATTHDLEAIRALLRACDLPFADLGGSHLAHFFVIKDADQTVGSIGLEICNEFGLLRSLAISPALRGQGQGVKLVKQTEAYARTLKINALYLLTTTADKFFSKLDYQEIPRSSAPAPLQATTEFQSICPDSAICMQKQL